MEKMSELDKAIKVTEEWLRTQPQLQTQLDSFVSQLKRRQVFGSHRCAKQTLDLLRTMVGHCRWATTAELMKNLQAVARILISAQPMELGIGNIIRRMLYLIREEHATLLKVMQQQKTGTSEQLQPSLQSVLAGTELSMDYTTVLPDLRQHVMESLGELIGELEDVYDTICESALEHIHANEIILTFGHSRSVLKFFKHVADKKRSFTVVVAEQATTFAGHEMARKLAESSIEAIVIPDSAVYAMMGRVNKVIMPCTAVMANGGLITSSGGHSVALAAKELSVPVMCITGLFKLCPLYPHNLDYFNILLSPGAVMDYEEMSSLKEVEVLNPAYDYLPPELIDLYITNMGGHQPSYIYRLLAEYYHHEDSVLSPQELA
mmetsp:Transcript_32710/g.43061  ORF Transcript_32710/g.43061 Transcript_32710/m.43061 type:complete len:377 (-) Transcript_32710:133-1263(-)